MDLDSIVWRNYDNPSVDNWDELYTVEADVQHDYHDWHQPPRLASRVAHSEWMILGSRDTLDMATELAEEWEEQFESQGYGPVNIRIRRHYA